MAVDRIGVPIMAPARVNHADHPEFGVSLRRLRAMAGMTQEELAGRAGLGVRTIRDLEHGLVSRPRRSSIQLLADALGLRGPQRDAFVLAARRRGVERAWSSLRSES